jgi:hypothetical protein
MASNTLAPSAPGQSKPSGFNRSAAVTRSLLGYGVIAGPCYLIVALGQALVRDGFDLTRHPLSLLANGPGGWVQTVNFVITGAMVVAAAVGIARAFGTRATSWALGCFGAAMIAAAVFPADPVDGFPIGTPEGMPTSITTTGLLHFVSGAFGFFSLAVSGFLAARALSRRGASRLAWYSAASGAAVAIGFFGGPVFGSAVAMVFAIWFSVLAGWTWLAILSIHLYRAAPDPNCAPGAV